MSKLSAAVVGARGVGAAHVAALRSLPDVEVVAVAGATLAGAERAAATLGVPRAVGSYLDLVEDPAIQVIHICTPNDSHAQITTAALARGKHVVCEKPLALTAEQGEAALRAATGSTSVAVLGYHYRFLPLAGLLRELVQSGRLGAVHAVRGSYLQNWMLSAGRDHWRADPAKAGPSQVLGDIGTHLMDLVEVVCGSPITDVTADLTPPSGNGPRDQAHLLLRLAGGTHATLSLSQVSAAHTNLLGLAVDGSDGTAIWSYDGREQLRLIDAGGAAQIRVDGHTPPAASGRYWVSDEPGDTALRRLLAAAYTRMRGGAPDPPQDSAVPLPGFAEGLRHLRVIEAAVAAARANPLRPVPAPLPQPHPSAAR